MTKYEFFKATRNATGKTFSLITASATSHKVVIDREAEETIETHLIKKSYAVPKNVIDIDAFINNMQSYVRAMVINDFQMAMAALADKEGDLTVEELTSIDDMTEAIGELEKATEGWIAPEERDTFATFLAWSIVRPRHFNGYGDNIVEVWNATCKAFNDSATDGTKKQAREKACALFSDILKADTENAIYGNIKCNLSASAFNDHVVSFYRGSRLQYTKKGITTKKVTSTDVFRQTGLAILKYAFRWSEDTVSYSRGMEILK
jgi:hypothetical protein